MKDPLDQIFNNYSDAEKALIDAKFVKKFDTMPSQFKYNWEYGLVDAGIKSVLDGWRVIQRA